MVLETFLGLILVLSIWTQLKIYLKRRSLPPGPFPWPVVGNLLSLNQSKPQKTFQNWFRVYGPIITVWMGGKPKIIINDYELMKDTLTRRGDLLNGRPRDFVFDFLMNGK